MNMRDHPSDTVAKTLCSPCRARSGSGNQIPRATTKAPACALLLSHV